MYRKLAKFVFNPFLDFMRGTKVAACLRELEKSQWFTREKLMEIQRENLRLLVRHAYENTFYYHMVLKERGLKPEQIRTVEDLSKLPILTKADVRRNFDDLTAMNFYREKKIPYTTGGSTGEPLKFYVMKKQRSWETAAMLRACTWGGYELGDKLALIWGSPLDISESESMNKKIMNFFLRRSVFDAYQLSQELMRDFALELQKLKPKVLRGYASAIYLFACFLEHEGLFVRPDAVITTAEMLFDHQRRKIEEVFGCEVYDSYGSREVEEIASECGEHVGYHISAENVVLEYVKNGDCIAPGEMGAILVTNLRNYAMPFIRYEIGDLGKPSDETCSCGRSLPLMKSIEGRITDIIVTPKKNFASIFDGPLYHMTHVQQYQVVQEDYDKILVKIVRSEDYSEDDNERIVSAMKQYLGEDVEVKIEFVDFIPLTSSGKRRYIISKVPVNFNKKTN